MSVRDLLIRWNNEWKQQGLTKEERLERLEDMKVLVRIHSDIKKERLAKRNRINTDEEASIADNRLYDAVRQRVDVSIYRYNGAQEQRTIHVLSHEELRPDPYRLKYYRHIA
jgi:hypothetical protein